MEQHAEMYKQLREPIPKRHQCIAEVLDGSQNEHVRKANQEREGNERSFGTGACGKLGGTGDVDGQS